MENPLRLFFSVLALSTLAALAQPAAARDRPGTPNDEKAWACGDLLTQAPAVCAEVANTASEPVRFETEVTVDGVLTAPQALDGEPDCLTGTPRLSEEEKKKYLCSPVTGFCEHPPASRLASSHSCEAALSLGPLARTAGAIARMKTGTLDRTINMGVAPQGIIVRDVAPGSEYCFRFRTRRVSDQVVSALWSNWACTTARGLPARPTAPRNASTTFLAPSWSGATQGVPLPNRVVMRWLPGDRAGWYSVHGKRFVRGKTSYEETLEVPASVIAAGGETVEFCSHNVSGKACTTIIASASAKSMTPNRGAIDAIREQQPKLATGSTSAEAIRAAVPTLQVPSLATPPFVPTTTPTRLTGSHGSLSATTFGRTPQMIVLKAKRGNPVLPTPALPGGGAAVPVAIPVVSPFTVGCKAGFTQRRARLGDTVCVTQAALKRTLTENATAEHHVQKGGRERGSQPCIAGYVWRQAVRDDFVCVRPATLALIAEENRLAASRAL